MSHRPSSAAICAWKVTWSSRSPSSSRIAGIVLGIDRLEQFVGLFQEVPREGSVGLLTIPRAAVGRAEPRLHTDQVEEPLAAA